MKTVSKLIGGLIGFAMIGMAGTANATLVLDITGGIASPGDRDFTLGWAFRVNSAITIDGLGIWDEGSNGLNPSVEVALWENSGQTLLRSTTVTSGSTPVASALAAGQWLFEDVAALLLTPGDYTIGYFRPADTDVFRLSLFTTIPEITHLGHRSLQGPSLTFPTSGGLPARFFGPNLRLSETAQLPEPSTLALFLIALGGLGFMVRRRVG